MRIKLYQIDAFTNRLFSGNPAAVCPLIAWPEDSLLQNIAVENNLSETAFFTGKEGCYVLRWFTPLTEVDLCGHATLATAHVILNELEPSLEKLQFTTRSGELSVWRAEGTMLSMNFPAKPAKACAIPAELSNGLNAQPLDVLQADDYVAVFSTEAEVRALQPDFQCLQALSGRGVIATAPGEHSDFVSRFFAPGVGINEDPVTGSAHCTLAPYWAEQLGKTRFSALQVSSRGGQIQCELKGDRVILGGECVKYLQGEIEI